MSQARRWACRCVLMGSILLPQYTLANQVQSQSPVVSGGSIVTMLLALGATLALIAVVAWLMKRLPQRAFGTPALLKVISSVAVVVVEAGDTWLVLGVAPGRVNSLHQMPRQEAHADANQHVPAAQRFAGWLKNAIEQRNRG
jgi:flagellar protein FliO/FliZ